MFDPDVGEDNAYGDKEILHLENVFVTPHIAGVTEQSYPRFFDANGR